MSKQEPFVIERIYEAPIEKVWKAITDKDQMKQWYFDIAEFKPEPGFEFHFEAGDNNKMYMHLCKITEVITGKKLTYSWRYEGYEGNSFVTFELFEEGDSTRLKLTHVGLETFPQNDPSFAKESFAGGWTYITGTSLKDYLEPAAKASYQKSITVNTSAEEAFKSLTEQIPAWWTENFTGAAQQLNDEFTVRFGNTFKTMLIEEIIPNKKLAWKCINGYLNMPGIANQAEWVGTKIFWQIIPVENAIKIELTHEGLTADLECYTECEKGWDFYFAESLYNFLTAKNGTPFKNI